MTGRGWAVGQLEARAAEVGRHAAALAVVAGGPRGHEGHEGHEGPVYMAARHAAALGRAVQRQRLDVLAQVEAERMVSIITEQRAREYDRAARAFDRGVRAGQKLYHQQRGQR